MLQPDTTTKDISILKGNPLFLSNGYVHRRRAELIITQLERH